MARSISGTSGAGRVPRVHKLSALLFGVAVLALVGAGVASWISVRNTTNTSDDLQDTLTVVAALDKTLADATVLQVAGRSYLVSKDSRMLDAYMASAAGLRIDVTNLKAVSEGNPERRALVDDLQTKTTSFAALLAMGMPPGPGEPPANGLPAGAAAIGASAETLRNAIRDFRNRENTLLSTEAANADDAAQGTLRVTTGVSAGAVAVLILTFVAMNVQIRRRRVAEAQLAGMLDEAGRLNQRAEDANRELEAFCYSVSHDLRAPLRTIDGFSKALSEDFAPVLNDDGQHLLQRIRLATQRMGQLIDDLLGLSRVTRGDFSVAPVNLSAIGEATVAELRAQDPHRQVTTTIQRDMSADGDERLLAVVLDNLLRNAWKYTGRHETANIAFGTTQLDGETLYFVKDDGAGFDMQYADKLFGVFQRLHHVQDFPGTGVGLATVQRIIFRHGGRVWAEAEPEKGATFYFTLGSAAPALARAA